MLMMLRNQMIRLGFAAYSWATRMKRVLRHAFQPRVGAPDHVTIAVRDLDVARRFYCEVLGAEHFMTIDDETFRRFGRPPAPNKGEGSHHVSVYPGGSTRIDLFLQQGGQPAAAAGHPHYAFKVPARHLLKWKARFEQRGIPSEGPLQLGSAGQASLYFNDPFGNHLELVCLGFAHPIPVRPAVMTSVIWAQEARG
ncbi:MAG TPA: VOC family protein [Steroidobacteraceae bacterium]|jgi:catechol 2,3-dioxygenase-like lactoylglutathione lyase family enzyme|nr:VOC family protein [Steroidobacteraceae bacterium]